MPGLPVTSVDRAAACLAAFDKVPTVAGSVRTRWVSCCTWFSTAPETISARPIRYFLGRTDRFSSSLRGFSVMSSSTLARATAACPSTAA